MMTFSKLANRTVKTQNYNSRNGVKVDRIVLHHMASTSFQGVLDSWISGEKDGSCNYAVSNGGEVVGVVSEDLRSWTMGSDKDGGKGAAFDRRSITFEIENAKYGDPWPVSAKAQEAVAQVVADIAKRHSITLNRTNVLGHREVYTRYDASYATACPGGLDMDWIVKRAIEINKPKPVPVKPAPTKTEPIKEEDDMDDTGFYMREAEKKTAGQVFWFNRRAGTKRAVGSSEWGAARAFEEVSGQPIIIAQVPKAKLDKIPLVK